MDGRTVLSRGKKERKHELYIFEKLKGKYGGR